MKGPITKDFYDRLMKQVVWHDTRFETYLKDGRIHIKARSLSIQGNAEVLQTSDGQFDSDRDHRMEL